MFFRVIFILMSLFLLSACDDSEKEARTMLNQALQDWGEGDIKKAELKFNMIEAKYLSTEAATESISKRALLKEKYKNENNVEKARRINRGLFSRKVFLGIEKYYQENSHYPKSLEEIKINDDDEYLALCKYQKASFEYGYQLNCVKADKTFKEDRRRLTRKGGHSGRENSKNKIKELDDFAKASSTWGEKFNASKQVPEKGFYAYYINTNKPSHVISKETVNDVSINYPWDDFHNIKSEDFGAYWVGRINLPKSEVKTIAVNQSWSKARLIIDGFIVYEGGSNKEMLLKLEKGSHFVEVEYVNNWHTTEFSLTFLNKVEKLSLSEIKEQLADNVLGEYEIYYAGLYESSNKDLSAVLNIEKTPKQIVLFLSSYSPVKWHISNPFMTDIRAIVYGSSSPGTTITGDLDSSTILFPSQKRIGSYSSKKKCRCTAGVFHCEGNSLLSTKEAVEQLSEYPMTGFSGKYSASSLRVPQVIVNERYLKDQKENNQKIAEQRACCKKQNDPNFEKMFDQ
jgi:hypothetical protein